MGLIAPLDAAFLLGESREHPFHIAGLYLYQRPPGAGPDFVRDLYDEMLTHTEVRPVFRRRPRSPVSSLGQVWWDEDDDIDLEYHVRLSALARPGRVRELLELASRLHGSLLDRHRPLWEYYLIDGLEGDRFATYTKMHHALVDGVTSVGLMMGALSPDPASTTVRPVWSAEHDETREPRPSDRARSLTSTVRAAAAAAPSLAKDSAVVTGVLAKLATQAARGNQGAAPYRAPRTMFNVPITGARRFAAQSWPMDRLKKAGAPYGATLNDIVLAMCSGALRRYLLAADALPGPPLLASVPVSLRAKATKSGGGNAIGMVLCNLATDVDDPQRRLEEIVTSMRSAKETLSALTPAQIQLLTMTLAAGPALTSPIPGLHRLVPPQYNVIISNVPGARVPLFLKGARLQGAYPVSIPQEGQALNITVSSYAGNMDFGLIGCRRTVPHLQRLLDYLDDSLADLES
jgi:WS/DGAT/MGAT family acyltransferase